MWNVVEVGCPGWAFCLKMRGKIGLLETPEESRSPDPMRVFVPLLEGSLYTVTPLFAYDVSREPMGYGTKQQRGEPASCLPQ